MEWNDERKSGMMRSCIELDGWKIQFLTGHGALRERLKRLGFVEDEFCRCGKRETAVHLLWKCMLFEDLRRAE